MSIRKNIAMLLSILLTVTSITAIPVSADTNKPTITVQSVAGTIGSTVDVEVTIDNNPGILGAVLSFQYDSGLTLVDAEAGDAFSELTMTKPGKLTSPCKFAWDSQELAEEDIKDGTIVTLQFKISDEAQSGTEYNISASYENGDITNADMQTISADIVNGKVMVTNYLPGGFER